MPTQPCGLVTAFSGCISNTQMCTVSCRHQTTALEKGTSAPLAKTTVHIRKEWIPQNTLRSTKAPNCRNAKTPLKWVEAPSSLLEAALYAVRCLFHLKRANCPRCAVASVQGPPLSNSSPGLAHRIAYLVLTQAAPPPEWALTNSSNLISALAHFKEGLKLQGHTAAQDPHLLFSEGETSRNSSSESE